MDLSAGGKKWPGTGGLQKNWARLRSEWWPRRIRRGLPTWRDGLWAASTATLMPKVRRERLPRALMIHLVTRVREREIEADQLTLLARWLDGEPEVARWPMVQALLGYDRVRRRRTSEDIPPTWAGSCRTGSELTKGSPAGLSGRLLSTSFPPCGNGGAGDYSGRT